MYSAFPPLRSYNLRNPPSENVIWKGALILAGVATFTVACALPSVACAQIGACPTLIPPPCIVNDPGRIAGIVAEIKEKKDQLENAVQQVQDRKSTRLNSSH